MTGSMIQSNFQNIISSDHLVIKKRVGRWVGRENCPISEMWLAQQARCKADRGAFILCGFRSQHSSWPDDAILWLVWGPSIWGFHQPDPDAQSQLFYELLALVSTDISGTHLMSYPDLGTTGRPVFGTSQPFPALLLFRATLCGLRSAPD